MNFLKIEYNPSRDFSNMKELQRFYHEYVEPFGHPRKAIELSADALVVRANSAGLLALSARLLDIAFGRLNELTFEQVEQTQRGRWFGDLEPGSPPLLVKRSDRHFDASEGFHYDSPKFQSGVSPPMENLAKFSLEIENFERGNFHVMITANASALVSFAKHVIYLAEPEIPVGTRVRYDNTRGLVGGRRLLVFEKTSFQDMPWSGQSVSVKTVEP